MNVADISASPHNVKILNVLAREAIVEGEEGDYVWGFFARSYREAQRMNQFSHMWLELWPQRSSFSQKNGYSCFRETITGWKQWIKILQQQKNVRNWVGSEINWTKKLSNFSCCTVAGRGSLLFIFAIWIFNWLFMRIYTIKPSWACQWMNAYNNYEFDH